MKNYFLKISFLLAGLIVLLNAQVLTGQITPSLFDRLAASQTSDFLDIRLEADFGTLVETKQSKPDYYEAQLSYEDENKVEQNWGLKLKARGKFRRMNCEFPPLKLNFPKGDLTDAGLTSFDKYKLVTHCIDDPIRAKENLLKELLSYQLYNAITPQSFRVILLRVKYVDTSGELPNMRRYAILIENNDELANRLNAVLAEDFANPAIAAIDRPTEIQHSLFQYMIGNTDYNVHMGRNVKLLKNEATNLYIPVGYDFDFSSFVNTGYAVLDSGLGQTSMSQRFYLGMGAEDDLLKASLAFFINKQEELIGIVDDFGMLTRSTRNETMNYLETFFAEAQQILSNKEVSIYEQLRIQSPAAIPPGGTPERYWQNDVISK